MHSRLIVAGAVLLALTTGAFSQEMKRRIISRADLTGTDKEIIMTETEVPPGAVSPRHTHPGEEAFYVLQGAMTQAPGQAATMRETGSGGINVREVPHAGYTVVGDKALKLINVYIVDKGKPLSTPAK